MAIGLRRDSEGWVRVRYADGNEHIITREQYEAQGYEPPFEALPLGDTNAQGS